MRRHPAFLLSLILLTIAIPHTFAFANEDTGIDVSNRSGKLEGNTSANSIEVEKQIISTGKSVSSGIVDLIEGNELSMSNNSIDSGEGSEISKYKVQADEEDDEDTEGTSNGFEYAIIDDKTVMITGYDGSSTGNLTIPETLVGRQVTAIGSAAFYECSGFTGKLTIPGSVATIGDSAFDGLYGITSVMNNSSLNIAVSNFIDPGEDYTLCFINDSNKDDWKISGEELGKGAYTKTSWPESQFTYKIKDDGTVEIIGYNGDLSGNLTIPSGIKGKRVTSIGYGAFKDHIEINGKLKIPDSVTEIGEDAFSGCKFITGIEMPKKTVTISDGAFDGCRNMKGKLILPSSLTYIGSFAFRDCDKLSGNLKIPAGISEIGSYTFSGCSSLTGKLIFPSSVKIVGSGAFKDCCGLTGNIPFPKNIRIIPSGLYQGCSGFTGLSIPSSVIEIEYCAFEGCSGLKGKLSIPSSVREIGFSAFSDCSGYTGNLTIPTNTDIVGSWAFSGCSGIDGTLTIPPGVKFSNKAFYNMYNVKKIINKSKNKVYCGDLILNLGEKFVNSSGK